MNGSSGKWLLHRSLRSLFSAAIWQQGWASVCVCWGAFWLIESLPLSRCGSDSVPYYAVVGVRIDEQWRQLLANAQQICTHAHARPNHREITAVLGCYAAVSPSSRITHTRAYTCKCETGTVTPGLAGSEGHRGIVTKSLSNKPTAHIICSAMASHQPPAPLPACPWPHLNVVIMNMMTDDDCFAPGSLAPTHSVFEEKCVECASRQTIINLVPL